MGEIFSVSINNVAVSAVQDILTAFCASTKKLRLLAVELAANGQTTVGNYPIELIYLPATVTHGSGGSGITPVNLNPDGASASFSAVGNNTTVSTTGGTAAQIWASQFNPINGWFWQAQVQSDSAPKADLSGAFVLKISSAPVSAINVSATMLVEEI